MRVPKVTMPARRRHGNSSHRLLDTVALFLPSRHHSIAPPSPKRYDKRYDGCLLSREEPNSRTLNFEEDKRCMLTYLKWQRIFRGGVPTQQHDGDFPRATPHPPPHGTAAL